MGSSQSMIECVYMDIPRPRTCVIHSDSASASAPPSHPRPGAVVGMAIWDDGRDSGYWFHCGSCNVLWGLDPPPDPWIQCPACPNCSTITNVDFWDRGVQLQLDPTPYVSDSHVGYTGPHVGFSRARRPSSSDLPVGYRRGPWWRCWFRCGRRHRHEL
jgi:hypothetical protein